MSAGFGPHGLLRGVDFAGGACVGTGDGAGVAFILILGIEEPLAALLVLHAFFVEFAVEGFCAPAELLCDLGRGVGGG